MFHNMKWRFVTGLGAALFLGCAFLASADEVNYYFPPYPIDAPDAPLAPGYLAPMPIVIIADDLITYDSDYDESRWERQERRNFHPGYQTWSDYYESPPWHHRNENDFYPWWTY